MKTHSVYASLRMLACLLLSAVLLFSCAPLPDLDGEAPLTTGAPAETRPPVTDADGEEEFGGYVFTEEQIDTFMSMVSKSKLSYVQELYRQMYVGEYKSFVSVKQETFDYIAQYVDITAICDVESATSLVINAYARVLGDGYAHYYTPEEYAAYLEDLNAAYCGIGVAVTVDEDGYIEILTVFPDSPAMEKGLLPGDVITHTEGEDVAALGYTAAVNKIRGEEGTEVTVTVLRDGESLDFTMERRAVTEYTVDYRMQEEDVGYIRITQFDAGTFRQFVEAYEDLEMQGAEKFVLDVRNNPGGMLNVVVAILEYLLPDGPIVKLDYKGESYDMTVCSLADMGYADYGEFADCRDHETDAPLVVLCNENTASAGELFTSALKDYEVAEVIGTRTYGKGVGQGGYSVTADGSVMYLTVFYYSPPVSENYNGVGVAPHQTVELSEEAAKKNIYKLPYEEDSQLQAALEHLG